MLAGLVAANIKDSVKFAANSRLHIVNKCIWVVVFNVLSQFEVEDP